MDQSPAFQDSLSGNSFGPDSGFGSVPGTAPCPGLVVVSKAFSTTRTLRPVAELVPGVPGSGFVMKTVFLLLEQDLEFQYHSGETDVFESGWLLS